MWSTPAAYMILLGIICDVTQVCSETKILQRKTDPPADEAAELQEDIQVLIKKIHSLSRKENPSPKVLKNAPLKGGVFSTLDGVDFNAYYSVLSNLYAVFSPLLRKGFIEDLPKTLVCIMSGRLDCGLEAELTKTVSLELGRPLVMFLSSLKSQTCAPLNGVGDEESSSFLRSFLSMDGSMISAFQEMFMNILVNLPLSGDMATVVNDLVDMAVTYFIEFMTTLLQTPMDYLNIGLQFVIPTPTFDKMEHCVPGDLKQLIVWGMKHNVTWSFGNSIIDIFLELLAPDQPLCTYPECKKPSTTSFQHMIQKSQDGNDDNLRILLKCDRLNLALPNDTSCFDIFTGARENPAVLTFCQALDSLTHSQLEHMWSNTCYVIEALAFLVFRRSSDCSVVDTMSPPADIPPSETLPLPHLQPHRVARRDTLNLNELVCNYNSWLEDNMVDAVHVSLCSDNKREEFVTHVCNNALLMEKLLLDQANSWLWGYCASSSADRQYMAGQFCHYEQWLAQYIVPDPSVLAFCLSVDSHTLKSRICGDIVFFSLVFSNTNNLVLMPNCSDIPPPPVQNNTVSVSESCQYSQWHDVTLISIDVLTLCIQLDPDNFENEVCANETFLNELIRNEANVWLQQHCNTVSKPFRPTEPPFVFSIADWCDYHTWAERLVDSSVIGLCWQNDKVAFENNICCNESLLEKLVQDPQNKWLELVCAEKDTEVIQQVCKYSEWNQPIVIDMTDLAVCAEMDPLNFTSKVCSNATVLQNLLTNLDNTWLIQHCANYSATGVSFGPAEQCQYSSWSTDLPDTTLLALCWDYDQANFVSSVCPDAGLLSLLAEKQATVWVKTLCTLYANHSTANNTAANSTNTTAEPYFCLVTNLVRQLNWTCSADFTSACQPGASQDMALQMMLRCWLESLHSRVEDLLTPPVTAVLEQAVSATVVILLAVEEVQNTSFHVTENIRLSVLRSVVNYLEREPDFEKKRVILQCFGRVLTNMMHTARDMTSDEYIIIKEYFLLPLDILRPVLSVSHITTVRLILQYYSRNKDKLQLSDEYLSAIVSVVLQTHLVKDGSLLSELDELLVAASPADIKALPPLQTNTNVREMINRNLQHMSPDQQRAFGWWYNKALDLDDIIKGHPSLIRDTGNLIAYLPFYNFQHLSAAQLMDGLNVLQNNTLSYQKQEFIANKLIDADRKLKAEDFTRLGNLTCLADPDQLHDNSETFKAIQVIIQNCARQGLSLPSKMIYRYLLNTTELMAPPSLTSSQLTQHAYLLPWLGVDFLQNLTISRLLPALPAIRSVPFSPAQELTTPCGAGVAFGRASSIKHVPNPNVDLNRICCGDPEYLDQCFSTPVLRPQSCSHILQLQAVNVNAFMSLNHCGKHSASIIIDKIPESNTLNTPGKLQELGSLIVGVKTESLWKLTPDIMVSSLPAMAQHTPGLSHPQANTIATKIWGFPDVVGWLNEVEPLLSSTPLISIMDRKSLLANNITAASTLSWNTQQAQAIFKEVIKNNPNLNQEEFLQLGTLAQGVSCKVLQKLFQMNSSPLSVRRILETLRNQPSPLHTSLKKCVFEELYRFEFLSELLGEVGADIALSVPIAHIKMFPADMMDTLRKMIIQDPVHFLLLSKTKQELLVEKILQGMGMYTGVYTEEEFRSLGVMATFVVDEVFAQVDRGFFINNLEFLRGFCYRANKWDIVARILQEPTTFGPVQRWNQVTLSQLDRFLFFLPLDKLQKISVTLMTVGRIERLFLSQSRWEHGHVGMHCADEYERKMFFEKQQFVLQFFLGFLKVDLSSKPPLMVPTCEILRTTAPSAWTADILTEMSTSAFSNCLELMGHDSFFRSYQRAKLLNKVKQIYGPVSSLSQLVISQMGGLAALLTAEELSSLQLSQLSSITALGAISTWNNSQLAALFAAVLRSIPWSESQLESSTLVAMGHIVCGATPAQMRRFNAVEFSKAVLWLGKLNLSCSEEQLLTLVNMLTHNLAFGTMDKWGSDVFIEIGALAAGLPDMAMSALVKEQIEGLTPLAVSLVSPSKFAAVFLELQLSMFSYEQAAAVTQKQLLALSPSQVTALDIVLTSSENRTVDIRGRSLGPPLSHSPLCVILGLLMLLILLHCPDLICPGT